MKIYDNIFDARRHIKRDDPESFTWRGIECTGLAETMEEAENHGYAYKLHCYDETLELSLVPGTEGTEHHVREMIFEKEKK